MYLARIYPLFSGKRAATIVRKNFGIELMTFHSIAEPLPSTTKVMLFQEINLNKSA